MENEVMFITHTRYTRVTGAFQVRDSVHHVVVPRVYRKVKSSKRERECSSNFVSFRREVEQRRVSTLTRPSKKRKLRAHSGNP